MGRCMMYARPVPPRCAALALCALMFPIVPAAGQTPVRAAASGPASPAAPAVDLQADARLAARVTLHVKGESLAACMDLAAATGVRLQISPAMSGRRVTLYAAERPLREVMASLADVARLTWRVEMPPASAAPDAEHATLTVAAPVTGYLCYQTEAQQRQERKWIAASENNAQYARTARSVAMQEAVRLAVAGRQDGKPSFADVLAAYTPDQIRRAADLSAQPMGVISASDQSHFHAHLIYAAPFTSLPPAAQSSIASLLDHPAYKPAPNGGGHYAPAVSQPAALAQAQVGLIAADGQLRLGVVAPGGKDVWVSPFDAVSGGSVAGGGDAGGANAELVAALGRREPLDLRRMPPTLRARRLRFTAQVKRTELPALLESVAAQTGLAITSDDFLQSNTTPYAWLLGDGLEVTLPEALSQIAKAYGHFITYANGGLRVQTLTPGLDLRSEPPADVLQRLRELTRAHLPARMPEYVALGGLSQAQTDLLATRQIPDVQQWMPRANAQRLHGVLRLYALLSPDERRRAESGNGFAVRDMNGVQRHAFEDVAGIGLPARDGAALKCSQSGLYVERAELRNGAETVLFHLAADTNPLCVVTYRLTIP